ncbi:MAG: hypothetical protein R3C39_05050 [Dehalococcoidia bacterium]
MPPTEAAMAAFAEASRRAANASGDHSISVEFMRDALLRDPSSSASRALAACRSMWRPPDLDPEALEATPGPSNSFQVFRLELGTATTRALSADEPLTTGAYLQAILETSPGIAEELGVTPEAFLECLQATLDEAPES